MELSALLSRIQFGFTIGFHILFPTLNIGLAVFLSIMEAMWLKTQKPVYLKICKFWTKIFALTFGMGVVSGIVMAYELGTNFGRFINAIGGILGPLFGYEVLSAFFLEAGFLGVMLFGWQRVGPKLHYAATLLVTVGTIISAFWIMSANSWMQTPAGYEIINDKYLVTSWWQAIINPSFLPRFTHMLLASLLSASFVIAGVSAWFLLKRRFVEYAKPCLSLALYGALILTPLQIWMGDVVGLKVYAHQPLKTAAMEGNWNTMAGAPLILFAVPDQEQARNLYEFSIPYGASLLNTHDMKGVLVGLNSAPRSDWPPVAPVFYGFRVMVGIGVLFLLVAFYGLWARLRGTLYTSKILHFLCILVSPLGFLATIAGWITAESGRQPWIIYQLMRTHDGASLVPASQVMISLILFVLIYFTIFIFYLYYLFKFIRKGPSELEELPMTAAYLINPKPEENSK